MKKLIVFFLVFALLFSFGCPKEKPVDKDKGEEGKEPSQPKESAEEKEILAGDETGTATDLTGMENELDDMEDLLKEFEEEAPVDSGVNEELFK